MSSAKPPAGSGWGWSGYWLYQLGPYMGVTVSGASNIDTNKTVLICPESLHPLRESNYDYKVGRLDYSQGLFGTVGYLHQLKANPAYGIRYGPISVSPERAAWVADGTNDMTQRNSLVEASNYGNALWYGLSGRHRGLTNIVWLDWHVAPKPKDKITREDFRVRE